MQITQYVFGILFSQGIYKDFLLLIVTNIRLSDFIHNRVGQRFYSKLLSVRFALGAWCLGCFFLVQIYSSTLTLTSHLTSPNQKPIVNSFDQIADTPGVSLTVDRGFGIDVILQQVSRLRYTK